MHPNLKDAEHDSSVVQFGCPQCSFVADDERVVRAHMSLSDTPDHDMEFIYMPEVTIRGLSENGEVISDVPGHTQLQYISDGLDTTQLDGVSSEQDELIVSTAVMNAKRSFQKLTELLNQNQSDSVEYHTVYQTVVDALALRRKSRDSAEPETKSFEDLTDKQQAIMIEYVRDSDQTYYQIAKNTDVSPAYPKRIIQKYKHIANNLREDTMSQEYDIPDGRDYAQFSEMQFEVLDTIARNPERSNEDIASELDCAEMYLERMREQYGDAIRNRRIDLGREEPVETDEPPMQYSKNPQDEAADESATEEPTEKSTTESTMSQTTSEDVPEAASTETTEKSNESVPETPQDPSRRRIRTKYAVYDVPEAVALQYNNRTQKQRSVLDEFIAEDNPENPSRTHSQIADDAGAHETYVYQLKSQYVGLANKIKQGTVVEQLKETPQSEPLYAQTPQGGLADELFPYRLKAAVEEEDVKALSVRDVRSNINRINDIELLESAQELDDRKTALDAFEERLDKLDENPDMVSPVEKTIYEVDTEKLAPQSATDTQTVDQTTQEEISALKRELQDLETEIEISLDLVESEIEYGSTDPATIARAATLKSIQGKIDEILKGRHERD
jgi:hypothetical protein